MESDEYYDMFYFTPGDLYICIQHAYIILSSKLFNHILI